MGKCHICGSETDYECNDCGELVCDNCTVSYDQFTQIDYTLCKSCGSIREESETEEYFRQKRDEEVKLKERLIKNEKSRKYYCSEKAIENRRIKKIQLQELRAKQKQESINTMAEIFADMFKYL